MQPVTQLLSKKDSNNLEEGLSDEVELRVGYAGEFRRLVERCLTRPRLFEYMCSDAKWDTIVNLVQFLRTFN